MAKNKLIFIRRDVQKELRVSQATALRLLMQMIDDGLIGKNGRGRNTCYVLIR